MKARSYGTFLELLKLARKRRRSAADYRAMQEYIAEHTVEELKSRGVELGECDVLELAAGRGGYSRVLNSSARTFLANDLNPDPYFAEQGIPFIAFDVMKPFPLSSGSFDLIYCSSLIEHVPEPPDLLNECRRVLRPGGRLFLSFPPFYSLAMVGGHTLQPYHFLGETLALRLHNWHRGTAIESYETMWGNWGLYPLTISRVGTLISGAGFEKIQTYTRMSPINLSRLPGMLKDLLTWHVCFLARSGG